jgi:hypothetical protein
MFDLRVKPVATQWLSQQNSMLQMQMLWTAILRVVQASPVFPRHQGSLHSDVF